MKNIAAYQLGPILFLFAILPFISGCTKDDSGNNPGMQAPVVTTTAVNNISADGATCGGTVTSDGGSTVTARGVCWSTGNTPTINDGKTVDGSGVGTFASVLTGLIANTQYFVRAYATNSSGVGYGNILSFTTAPQSGDTVIHAPTQIQAASADGAIILSWASSISENSSYFGKYVITGLNETTNNTFTVVAPKGVTKFVVDSLMNGTRYMLTVRSEKSNGQLSSDYSQIEWSPAVRQNLDLNAHAILVYTTTSAKNSAVDLYTDQGFAEVIPQTGQTFRDRGDLYVYAADNTSATIEMTSPSQANNQGLETQFSTNSGVAANSLDDQLATSSPKANSYISKSIQIADAAASSGKVYFGRLKRGIDFYYFRLLVKLGSNGKLVQGGGADRYLELVASFQSSANTPFAKKMR